MANRQQRRQTKKMLNRPELKQYVDKFCMEISSMLVDYMDEVKKKADEMGVPVKEVLNKDETVKQVIDGKLHEMFKAKGEELGRKVQEITNQHKQSQFKVKINGKASL